VNIVQFAMNSPVEIALQSPQGTVVQGRYGDRVMFHLADGRVMYVPPIVADKIAANGIPPGELFELCKARVSEGRRRSIRWQVRRLARDPAQTPSESQLESDLRDSIAIALKNRSHPDAASANGDSQHSIRAEPSSPSPSTKLEHALKTAISAACSAEKFGAELGYVVRFDSDAIKSMAITVLINMSEGGRR
jgi:hypothetical protein